MSQPPEFSILVPNWNGAPFLRRGLGALLLAARFARKPYELIVVDDASKDKSAEIIEREFPTARLIRNAKNEGFARAVNKGARLAAAPILVFANNDLIVREDFIARLLAPLDDAAVFAVSAKTIDWNRGKPNQLAMSAVWRDGLLAARFNDPQEVRDADYAQGGACALRRDLFLEMGGFCRLYEPGYWEDYDLSYWARKRGMRVVYEPMAIGSHLGQGSMAARYGRDKVKILGRRNQVLFTWVNLSDARLWLRHWIEFPAALCRDLARTPNSPLTKGFLRALGRLPGVLAARRARKRTYRLRDREILP